MKLAWMFGSSMAARHLLYTYLTVWIVQGGYAGWAIWQWMQTRTTSQSASIPSDSSNS